MSKMIPVISRQHLDDLFPTMIDMIMDSQKNMPQDAKDYFRSFLEEVVRPAFNENFLYTEIPAVVYENGHKLLLDDPNFKKYAAKKRREKSNESTL